MKEFPDHTGQKVYLNKIKGQILGIEKMIEGKRYCVDIITQIHSVIGALYRIENEVFRKHIDSCVVNAIRGKSELEKQKKVNEIIELVSRFRKAA